MAYTTINDPTQYFQTALWSGTGGALTVTNDGNSDLKPDFLWVKNRNNTGGHRLHDSNRPLNNTLKSHVSDAEGTETDLDMTFATDGFSLDKNAGDWNFSGRTYVGWQWKANGGTTSSNTDGSITSTVQANTTAGFSIASYTGAGGNQTIGHGLGVVPSVIIVKSRSVGGDWTSYHSVLGNTKFMRLNSTNAVGTQSTYWQDTDPTSSVFSVGNAGDVNTSSGTHIAYCFAEKKGYSKFKSYIGNGSTDGAFVNTGFKPAWVMIKQSSGSGTSWNIWDNKRLGYNTKNYQIEANTTVVENTSLERLLITSNGFKCLTDNAQINGSGNTYIYMAFAEHPFVSSTGTPVTAR